MGGQMVIAALLKCGDVIGYAVPPKDVARVKAWLEDLPFVLDVWMESRAKFARRRDEQAEG